MGGEPRDAYHQEEGLAGEHSRSETDLLLKFILFTVTSAQN
jgi:hypothetical protein